MGQDAPGSRAYDAGSVVEGEAICAVEAKGIVERCWRRIASRCEENG